MTSAAHPTITSAVVRNVRDQMAAQSQHIGAAHYTSMTDELRMSPAQANRLTTQALAMKLSSHMEEHARIESVPFLDVDINKMHGESSDQTRIEVVAVHPAVWSRITRLLRDLEWELNLKEPI